MRQRHNPRRRGNGFDPRFRETRGIWEAKSPPPSAAGDRLLGPPPPRHLVARWLPGPEDASQSHLGWDAFQGLGDADAVPKGLTELKAVDTRRDGFYGDY